MATVAKNGTPKPTTEGIPNDRRVGSGLICGEDLGAGDACYIKSDGLVWKSIVPAANAALTAASKVHGYASEACLVAQNDSVTLYDGIDWKYGSGMTPGTDLYVSKTTAGALDNTVQNTNAPNPVGFAIDAQRVRLYRSSY